MSNCRINRIALTLGALFVTGLAAGQDKLNHPSLESTISKADIVFVGRVTAVSKVDKDQMVSFTVSADDDIKGVAKGTVELTYYARSAKAQPEAGAQRLLQSHEASLWFLSRPQNEAGHGYWHALPLDRPSTPRPPDRPYRGGEELQFDAGYGYPMFSEDLSVLSTKQEILRHAQAFVKHHPGAVKIYELPIPGPVAERTGWTFAINHIDVPLTDELENTAKRLIHDPDFLLPATWKTPTFFFDIAYGRTKEGLAAFMRYSGVMALAEFKSNANIALLKSLLEDSGVELAAWSEYPATRSYIVREAAYKVLTGWGIAVPDPSKAPTTARR